MNCSTVASKGTLRDPKVLEQQVKRMLADPKSEALTNNFAGQWLFLRDLRTRRHRRRTSTTTCVSRSAPKRKCCSRTSSAKTTAC